MDAIEKQSADDVLEELDTIKKSQESSGMDLLTWTTMVLGACDDAEERLKVSYEKMLKEIDGRRTKIEYLFGDRIRKEIDAQLEVQRKQGSKKKSIRNLYGVAGYRTISEDAKLVDKEAAFEWARENYPNAIKPQEVVPESLDWSALKAYIMDSGEEVPGIEYIPEHPKHYIKPEPLKLEKK